MQFPYINRAVSGGTTGGVAGGIIGGPIGGTTQPPPITKTLSQVGQVLQFDAVRVFIKTAGNLSLGVQALPDDGFGTRNTTTAVLDKSQRLRVLVTAKNPSPPIQGQPADSWALPATNLFIDSQGNANRLYMEIVRLGPDFLTPDPASTLTLHLDLVKLNNFNNSTQKPFTTFDAVEMEMWFKVYDAVSNQPVNLETSRGYDLLLSPELPFEWYTP